MARVAAFVWVVVCAAACSSDGGGADDRTPVGGDLDAGTDDPLGFGNDAMVRTPMLRPPADGGMDAGVLAIDSIDLTPVDPVLDSVNGSTPELQFETEVTYEDGTKGPALGPIYEIDPLALGNIDEADGTFVANGLAGGQALVTVTVPNPAGGELTAETTITVNVRHEVLGDMVPSDVENTFADAPVVDDAARRAAILYPLDGAVMPQNVYPAHVQWDVGVENDLYRVTLKKPHVELTAYVAHVGAGFEYAYLPDVDAWRALAQSDPADAAEIVLERWDSAADEVIVSDPVEVTFAQAAITGSVYYWDIGAVRIMRIDDGTADRVSFMPEPPASKDGGENCVGCHSVSPSGRYMAGRLGPGQNIGGVFDLTEDLTSNPPPTVYPLLQTTPYSLQWWFSSWNPDEDRLVVTMGASNPQSLVFVDPFTGMQVAPTSGTMPTSATHPAWAPDGSAIAFILNPNAWGGANTTGDVALLPVTGPDAVGTVQTIHTASSLSTATPAGNADSYPTWSPDSERIAFGHGSSSRSETGQAALYLMARDGTNVVRLDRANDGPDTVNNFQPRFAPFRQGGYYWLSYLSKRVYGNAEVGSANPTATCLGSTGPSVQQIWVSAVREDALSGEDASEVGYWLPGQDPRSCNISAFWAPRPCRPDGESCTTNAECCGGDCRPNADGDLVCAPPPPDRCREEGETCTTSADCCAPKDDAVALECVNRVCVVPPPECVPRGDDCETDADCCAPYKCVPQNMTCDLIVE